MMSDFEKLEKHEEQGSAGETGWDTLGRVGFGEEGRQAVAETVERRTETLRATMDFEKIAETEDPEGYANVVRKGIEAQQRVEAEQAELESSRRRIKELGAHRNEIDDKIIANEVAFSERQHKTIVRVKKFFGIGDKKSKQLQKDHGRLTSEYENLGKERRGLMNREEVIEDALREADPEGPKREFLKKFERSMLPDQKEKLLKFDALSELSTEEYLKLWRQLNPFYVTHVTRQGVRDHSAMIYHSVGVGDFHDGMTAILADGKVLKSPAGATGLDPEVSKEGVAKCLEKWVFNQDEDPPQKSENGDRRTITRIVDTLPINAGMAAADHWGDRRAIHFAQHTVLDDYYGGESENEAFFVFPTDVVASQCLFGGHMHKGLTTAQVKSERKWNDLFVWAEDDKIPVDAGLTFLPKSTRVDPKTGSRYASTENPNGELTVVKDEDKITAFVEFVEGIDGEMSPEELSERALRILGNISGDQKQDLYFELGDFIKYGIGNNLYISDEERAKMTGEDIRKRSIREFLASRQLDLKVAEDTVTAEEYWESYFDEHPEQRPAHIIYYDGDPTRAVNDLLAKNGILEEIGSSLYDRDFEQKMTGRGDSSKRDGGMLGFQDHFVEDTGSNDPRIQAGHEKFNQLAREVIAEHYGLVDK
ncbi:MAG: hypothetical protein Q4B29_02375 [Candidatus Saccharibacteria bacterium]|nr:hypothetical protein [Candidatus Saccharibacteria bacterium]